MAKIERLVTQPEREASKTAKAIREIITPFADHLPAAVVFPMFRELRKLEAAGKAKGKGRKRVHVDAIYLEKAANVIRALPGRDRPILVSFALLFSIAATDWDTGLIALTRQDLAARLKVTPDKASAAMDVLGRFGIVAKHYKPIPGLRGRGNVYWTMNPHCAWVGYEREEAEAVHAPPKFLVVEGGAQATPTP